MRYRSRFSGQTPFKDIDTTFRQVRLTHIAYIVSTLIYGIVGIFLKQFVMGSEPGFVGLDLATYFFLFALFTVISVGLGFIILVIMPKRNSPELLIKREAVSSLAELGQVLAQAQAVNTALAEAIAIFGLVLFFLRGDLLHLFAFAGVALVLLIDMLLNKAL